MTYIEHVVVDEAHRGQGYGTALIAFAEARALEEGCKLVELDVDMGDDRAEKLYVKSGYSQIGTYFQKEFKDEWA